MAKIGDLKRGLNRPSWDMLSFDSHYLPAVIKTGLITGIISLTVSPHDYLSTSLYSSLHLSKIYLYLNPQISIHQCMHSMSTCTYICISLSNYTFMHLAVNVSQFHSPSSLPKPRKELPWEEHLLHSRATRSTETRR